MYNDNPIPQKGTICVYQNGSRTKLGVVIGASSVAGWSRFTPVHTYPEYATDNDLVITPVASGLTYTIVLPTDLVTTLPNYTLTKTIGALPPSVLFTRPATDNANQHVHWGTPTVGCFDARLDLRHAERKELAEITSNHLDELLGELDKLEESTSATRTTRSNTRPNAPH